jgi:hypothetical protein
MHEVIDKVNRSLDEKFRFHSFSVKPTLFTHITVAIGNDLFNIQLYFTEFNTFCNVQSMDTTFCYFVNNILDFDL